MNFDGLDTYGKEYYAYFLKNVASKGFRGGLSFLDAGGRQLYDKGYNPDFSIIPFYDAIYEYYDNLKMMEDFFKNTGQRFAYGTRNPMFMAGQNLMNDTRRQYNRTSNDLFQVGKLAKRL